MCRAYSSEWRQLAVCTLTWSPCRESSCLRKPCPTRHKQRKSEMHCRRSGCLWKVDLSETLPCACAIVPYWPVPSQTNPRYPEGHAQLALSETSSHLRLHLAGDVSEFKLKSRNTARDLRFQTDRHASCCCRVGVGCRIISNNGIMSRKCNITRCSLPSGICG